MKRAFAVILLMLAVSGCSGRVPVVERPSVNVPMEWRESNYLRTGSCVHASLITLLRWQGQLSEAARWRGMFSGGEWASSLKRKMESEHLRYAYVTNGDVRFLDWACRTRRGCGITVDGGAHMVTLVHLDDKWAAILDNNDISKFIWIPRGKLIAEWRASLGWAVTPVYSPAAPVPW